MAMIASLGVVGAAVYALRLYIRSMHNRVGAARHLVRDRLRRRVGDRADARGDPRARLLSPVRAAPLRAAVRADVIAGADRAAARRPPGRLARVRPVRLLHSHELRPHRRRPPARARTSTGRRSRRCSRSAVGALIVLLVGLFRGQLRPRQRIVPLLTVLTLGGRARAGDRPLPPSGLDHLRRAADRRPRADPRHAVRGRRDGRVIMSLRSAAPQ